MARRSACRSAGDFAPPKVFVALVVLSAMISRGFFDQGQRQVVAFLVVVGPVDEAVLAHDDAFGLRVFAADFLSCEAEVETGAQPGGPDHFVAVDLLRQLRGVLRGGDGDRRVGVRVVDVLERERTSGAACRWRARAG